MNRENRSNLNWVSGTNPAMFIWLKIAVSWAVSSYNGVIAVTLTQKPFLVPSHAFTACSAKKAISTLRLSHSFWPDEQVSMYAVKHPPFSRLFFKPLKIVQKLKNCQFQCDRLLKKYKKEYKYLIIKMRLLTLNYKLLIRYIFYKFDSYLVLIAR